MRKSFGSHIARLAIPATMLLGAACAEEPHHIDPSTRWPQGELQAQIPDWVVLTSGDAPFDLTTHFALGTDARACATELSMAAAAQDIANATASAAHFDNCAFDEALTYIAQLEAAAKVSLDSAQVKFSENKQIGATEKALVRIGLFRLGQVLHAVQDFYSHSNYVESMEVRAEPQGIQPLNFFRGASDAMVKILVRDKGLISGVWFLSGPKRCSVGSPLHARLAKDEANKGHGGDKAKSGHSYYFDAVLLARRSTEAYLKSAVETWPVIGQVCGLPLGMNAPRELRKE